MGMSTSALLDQGGGLIEFLCAFPEKRCVCRRGTGGHDPRFLSRTPRCWCTASGGRCASAKGFGVSTAADRGAAGVCSMNAGRQHGVSAARPLRSPLRSQGHAHVVQLLLRHRATDINQSGGGDASALFQAAKNGHVSVVQVRGHPVARLRSTAMQI